MNDLEITQACARAMGYGEWDAEREMFGLPFDNGSPMKSWMSYDPLHDDAQCFALVKQFELRLQEPESQGDRRWRVTAWNPKTVAQDTNLNRAICEVVAKLAGAK